MNNRMLENVALIDKPYKGKIKGTNDGAMIKAAGAQKGIPKTFLMVKLSWNMKLKCSRKSYRMLLLLRLPSIQ